ncbi:MAG: hypothetical protein COV47_04505 [Candidatus Diapherotrites archaeon CG11_big_fil_rev_8_21_14_0_20_37_9]|nr:MAG: hypothetical protein COV47_04505 [Candidatus Diapherotrites archaeon CG11_big_fil_rev_8_21_14_0_20_37_9]
MFRRKLQLVAGTTYTISLPKEWVSKNGLRAQNELTIMEKDDGDLIISSKPKDEKKLLKFTLNIDKHLNNIDQVLFAIYYLGIEEIHLYSKSEMGKETKSKIRKTLKNMSGTEISFEDQKNIEIMVLLDKSKININQLLYRISLIIDSTFSNLETDLDLEKIKVNENEIDRLYHLMAKIISVSSINSSILQSSEIRNSLLIPNFSLIAKRLEHTGDFSEAIADYISEKGIGIENKAEIFLFFRKKLQNSITNLRKATDNVFEKTPEAEIEKMRKLIKKNKDKIIAEHLGEILILLVDIEEEVTNISFYRQLIRNKLI